MIQKVLPGEYLRGYEKMTDAEREVYRKRVGEWLHSDGKRLLALTDRPMAKAQNLMQISTRWSREDCRALHDGAVLLSALANVAETWLPSQLWVKSAWRGVRQIASLLSEVKSEKLKVGNDSGTGKPLQTEKQMAQPEASAAQTIPVGKPHGTAVGIPARPKHIDQYLYLLPKGTQERGAMVRGLLRELDDAREKARLLMGSPQASPASMAAWAQKATKIDTQLRKIYRELDSEWEKLVKGGRITVDDLGNAHVVKIENEKLKVKNEIESEPAKRGRKPMTAEQKAAKQAKKEEQKHQENHRKAGLLRKWLIDLRNAKTPEQQEKWRKKYKEMVKLGGEDAVTEKVKAAAAFYDVEINGKTK